MLIRRAMNIEAYNFCAMIEELLINKKSEGFQKWREEGFLCFFYNCIIFDKFLFSLPWQLSSSSASPSIILNINKCESVFLLFTQPKRQTVKIRQ